MAKAKDFPTVPSNVIALIQKYGDQRADNDPAAHSTIGQIVAAIRPLLSPSGDVVVTQDAVGKPPEHARKETGAEEKAEESAGDPQASDWLNWAPKKRSDQEKLD